MVCSKADTSDEHNIAIKTKDGGNVDPNSLHFWSLWHEISVEAALIHFPVCMREICEAAIRIRCYNGMRGRAVNSLAGKQIRTCGRAHVLAASPRNREVRCSQVISWYC